MARRSQCLSLLLILLPPGSAVAQANYEIQVYGSETTPRGETVFEMHNNFTFQGTKQTVDGVHPTNHQLHETLEITHGFNDWFEIGLYQFTSAQSTTGWQWVGSHIRPRVRAPENWHWPVGVSLSSEFGYQRPSYSTDTWTWEIRPIIDKQLGKVYLAFNPALERSLHGPGVRGSFEFSPNFKLGYGLTRKVSAGIEYYGSLGPVTGFDPFRDQFQQFIPSLDIDFGPNWEFNFGVGVGVTGGTEHLLVKMIIGRRFGRKQP
jgi:hypothetical protein